MDAAYARAEALMTRPLGAVYPGRAVLFRVHVHVVSFLRRAGADDGHGGADGGGVQALRPADQRPRRRAAELYRGEAYSVQGRFEEADIQAYQAAFLSEQSRSATVTYGAALLLGINAIYRSDMAGLQKAVDYLENKARSYAFCRAQAWAHTWRRRCGAICWG